MRDTLVVIGFAFLAIVLGAWFYFNHTASPVTAPVEDHTALAVASVNEVAMTTLTSGLQSSVIERKNYAITTNTDFEKLWKMTEETGTPPVVDFSQNEVIAVFAGKKPSSGYSIAVSKVEDGSNRLVTITLSKPGATCVTGDAVTSPYQIVVIPRTSLQLAHQDLETTTGCQ